MSMLLAAVLVATFSHPPAEQASSGTASVQGPPLWQPWAISATHHLPADHETGGLRPSSLTKLGFVGSGFSAIFAIFVSIWCHFLSLLSHFVSISMSIYVHLCHFYVILMSFLCHFYVNFMSFYVILCHFMSGLQTL